MEYWLMAAMAGLGALAMYFAGRLVLLKRDLKDIAEQFTLKVNTNTNTLIGTGSWDGAVRGLADKLNEALVVYRAKRHLYEASDQRMREDIADLAHDLRTPLTAVIGYLSLLEANPEKSPEYVEILRGRADLMADVIEELFEYALSRARRTQRKEPVDLRSVLEETALGLYTQFEQAGIQPVLSMPEQPVVRRADRTSAQRMFGNVISNAIRHGEGDVGIALDADGTVIIENKASGIGLLDTRRLFDRYFSVQAAERSSGLGLGIARAFAEDMGGAMRAELDGDMLRIIVELPEQPLTRNK